MITLAGKARNIINPIIGIVTTKPLSLFHRKNRIFVSEKIPSATFGYSCSITSKRLADEEGGTLIHSVKQLQLLNDGDVVFITPAGQINIMYQSGREDHTIFITNRCNSRCIMCPQPPGNDPPDLHQINNLILSLIEKGSLKHIGITGGEPTLVFEQLCEHLSYLKKFFPNVFISLLTNGRKFCEVCLAKRVAAVNNKKLLFCIPVYADNDTLHNSIVGIPNAFQETIQGIYNLQRVGRKIEIRIVVMKQNFKRLKAIAEFIYRNLSFVAHIAFMGMEYAGEAKEHLEDLWIDPKEYYKELYEAVWHLHRRAMNVSIYNIPLCLLERPLWRFARDSISEWKKNYLHECEDCLVKETCGGVFGTSSVQSKSIHRLVSERV